MKQPEISSPDLKDIDKSIESSLHYLWPTAVRIYGPADRHGAIEWMYLLEDLREARVYISFALWAEADDAYVLEGSTGVTTAVGVQRSHVERHTFSDLGGITAETVFVNLIEDTVKRGGDIHYEVASMVKKGNVSKLVPGHTFIVHR
jgi:hypothetical protein